jgi:hypothetical protein
MAAPPSMPMGDGPLEPDADEMGGAPDADADDAMSTDDSGELDPQFASDVSEAFPDLSDAQLSALQRAVMGLMVR